MAAHAVLALERARLGAIRTALGRRVAAARMESAARRWRDEARHLAGDVADLAVRARHALEQLPCVGMGRTPEERVGGSRFHFLTSVHDDDAVADLIGGQ